MQKGYIKLNRSIMEHWLWKDEPFDKARAWIDLLLLANHDDCKVPYKGNVIICERGTVNKSISWLSDRWHWSRDKTRRFLHLLESDDMCTVNATTNRTTITIVNYGFYQGGNTTDCTTDKTTDKATSRQRADTYKNDKNEKNEKNIYKDIVEHLNEKADKSFKYSTPKTKSAIDARIREGFTFDDFIKVIDKKCAEWKNSEKMNQYLRPETLFGTKFEGYLNQEGAERGRSSYTETSKYSSIPIIECN